MFVGVSVWYLRGLQATSLWPARLCLLSRSTTYIHVGACGLPLVVKNRSQRFFTPGFLPFALRAVLRTFKFIPDEFVEPAGLTNDSSTIM